MAKLTLQQIFGINVQFVKSSETQQEAEIRIKLKDFLDAENGGEIQNGLGFDDVDDLTLVNINDKAEAVFVALIHLISQNQAAAINDDSEQKLFISDGGRRFATGNRNGQIQRVASINIFSESNIQSIPDLDDV